MPWRQRWREFRIKVIPALVFAVTGVVVAQLWSDRVVSANLQGLVVGARAEVGSPQGGVLSQLAVDRFQHVTAGTVVGQVITTDPKILAAQLSVVLAEVEMIRQGLGPVDNLRRDQLDRSTLDMNLMSDRIALASARIEQARLDREHDRVAHLQAEGLSSIDEYDRLRTERDRLALEIDERESLIETMTAQLARMDSQPGFSHPGAPLAAALRMQEERLRLIEAELTPIAITAPIDGRISRVMRRNGETVVAGEPIVVVHSMEPEYVLGFLPHPLRIEPEPGMRVVVRSRSTNRAEYEGEIVVVGAQIEAMDELQNPTTNQLQTGLPVKISLSDETNLRPGEVVEMKLFQTNSGRGSENPGSP